MESASGGPGEVGFGARLDTCLRALAALVGEVEPERFTGESARVLTELFAWGERLCSTGKTLVARRVVDTGAWERTGERTAADWLGRVSGQTAGQAAVAIVTARRVRQQPDVERAARAGRLSDQQSAAVTAAAGKAPDHTAELLARAGTDSLLALRERSREIVLAADQQGEAARHRAIHAGRYLRWWADEDGAARISGRFTPERLALVVSALQPFQDHVFAAARTAGTRERRECHAADALVDMALAAAGPHPTTTRPDPTGPSSSDGDSAGGGSGGGAHRPAQIIVRIDHAALVRDYRHADECSDIDGIGPVPVATIRAMTADAYLAAIVTDGTDIRSVVHLGRSVTALQRTALIARDRECVVPGCHTRHDLEIDHVDEWAATRTTRLDSLARLCHHHHHQKTYEGWKLRGPPGHWRWQPPPEDNPNPPPNRSNRPTTAFFNPRPPPTGGPPRRAPPNPPPPQTVPTPAIGSLFDPGEEPFPP